jgi:hypothetical protein
MKRLFHASSTASLKITDFTEINNLSIMKFKLIYDLQSVGQYVFHDQIFVLCLRIAGFLMWGALSDERTGL